MKASMRWISLVVALSSACATGDSTIEPNPFDGPSNASGNTAADDPLATSGSIETTGISGGDASADTGGTSSAEAESGDPAGSSESSGGEALCGDGVLQGAESCDGEDLGTASCADFGFTDGTLVCDGQCNLLTDGCRSCGDGMLAPTELCDGTALGGETCVSQGFGGGTLQCTADCSGFNTDACDPLPSCGDGVRNGAEQCDGPDLGGATCQSLGFDAGSLGCSASCTHQTDACEFLGCGQQGSLCLFDPNNPQSTCCAAGVGGNVLGLCVGLICQ